MEDDPSFSVLLSKGRERAVAGSAAKAAAAGAVATEAAAAAEAASAAAAAELLAAKDKAKTAAAESSGVCLFSFNLAAHVVAPIFFKN